MIEKVFVEPTEWCDDHRDLREIMERIFDNGIVLDAGDRLKMISAPDSQGGVKMGVMITLLETHRK